MDLVYSGHLLLSVIADQGPHPGGCERKGLGYPREKEVWGEMRGSKPRRVRDTTVGGRVEEGRTSEKGKRE